jgi:hypothetical protein
MRPHSESLQGPSGAPRGGYQRNGRGMLTQLGTGVLSAIADQKQRGYFSGYFSPGSTLHNSAACFRNW